MKNRSKILLALLIVLTLMVSAFTITASAVNFSGGTKLYLKPSANWQKDGARFAAYFFNNSTGKNAWVSMTDADGDGVYEAEAPSGTWANVIFCRMNGGTSANNWNNKWNQTGDLTFDGSKNLFTINASTWDGQTSGWSKYDPPCTNHNYDDYGKCKNNGCTAGHTYTIAGTGAHLGTEWDPSNAANDMTFDAATKVYTKVYENVAAGRYEFKCAQDHAWDVSYPPDNYVLNVAVSGSTITITFNANNNTVTVNAVAPVAQAGSNYYFDLQSAINAAADGETVTLLADSADNVTFVRAADLDIVFDGNGKTFSGSITIDGKSATYKTGSLTIKNVKFNTTGIAKDAAINFGGNNSMRYVTNVTVENCTFTGEAQAKVAIKSYTGGDKNIVVTGCTVDNTMHSLLQIPGANGLVVDNCTVNSKNGINLNNSSNVEITNSTVNVSGYAVRAGASSQGDSGAVTLTNNVLKSAATDEGVIVLRGLAQKNIDLVMTENVISGAIHVQGTTADTKVSAEANYWDGQKLPTVSGEAFYVKTFYPTEDKEETELSHLVATLNGVKYDSYTQVFADAVDGDEVIIVTPGTYKLIVTGKNITVTAAVEGVIFEGMGAYNMGGANVTFNNVTFNWTNANYKGLQHCGNLVYNNCTVNGQVFLYGESNIFNGCSFTQTSANAYNVWNYSSKHTEFNGCTFNSAGKALLVYHESANTFNEVVITKTVFNASELVAGKAAIEIDTSLTAGANISIDGATVANGFDAGNVSGNSLWNNKKGNAEDKNNDIIIVVDGETVLEPLPYYVTIGTTQYTSLQAAVNKAKNGDVIVLSDNVILTETLVVDGKSITLDLNGKTLSFAAVATFSTRNANVLISVIGGANVKIDGKGLVLTNGATFAVEEGSELEIITGTFDADVSAYTADGLRVVVAPQADGSVLYGVVSHFDIPYIGENGNWFVGDYDTGAVVTPDVTINDEGYLVINGVNSGYLAPTNGITPEITIIDGVWYVDLKDGNGFQSTAVVAKPVDGIGINNIVKVETVDNVDKYVITYSDGTVSTFFVANGINGNQGATGNTGLQGQNGAKGDRGDPGANGLSNAWLVNTALIASLVCVLLTVGVVLVLNNKRLNWWSK